MKLYHVAFSPRIEKFIDQYGIKADEFNMVYLSEKPISRSDVVAKYEVEVPNEDKLYDWRDFWEDDFDHTYDPDNPYYIYLGNIPKDYIRKVV